MTRLTRAAPPLRWGAPRTVVTLFHIPGGRQRPSTRSRTMRSRKATMSTVLAVVALTSVTACSQGNSGSGSGSGSSGGSGNSAAEKEVEQFLTPPDGIPIDQPLAACPEEGKTIIVTENPQAVTRKT